MADNQNRRRGEKFAQLVGLVMMASDVAASARPPFTTLAAAIRDERQASDFVTRDWSLSAFNEASPRYWSAGLTKAEKAAQADGKDLWAGVWHRPTRDADAQFVVMELGIFMKLLSGGLSPQKES